MYVGYVEYPFEIRCSNCSASLSSSLLETRKMTANIFGHFSFFFYFFSPFGIRFYCSLAVLPTKRNETKREEKLKETNRETRNETKRNEIQIEIEIQIWIWILLKLLLLIAKYTHRAEQRESCNVDRGDTRGMWGEAVCCCCCLFLSCSLSLPRWLAMLFCLNINDDENTRNYSASPFVYALGQPVFMLIFSVFFPFPFFGC